MQAIVETMNFIIGLREDSKNDYIKLFYDALSYNESARKLMDVDILKQIARDLTVSIKNSVSIDWSIRESVQAKMRMTIKRLLKKYGYPPDKAAKAIDIVMEQTKLVCSNEVTYGTSDRDNSLADRVAEEKGEY